MSESTPSRGRDAVPGAEDGGVSLPSAPRRRSWTSKEKLEHVERYEAAAASRKGRAYLQRHDLTYALVNGWRAQRDEGTLHAGTGKPITAAEISSELRARIDTGELRGQLPTYRQLAAHYRVHFGTIQAAYETLEADGIILRDPRRGAFVIEPQNRAARWSLADLDATIAALQRIRDSLARDLTSAAPSIPGPSVIETSLWAAIEHNEAQRRRHGDAG